MRHKWLMSFAVFASVLLRFLPSFADEPPKIEWSNDTLTLIERGAGYGRMIRLKNGGILCCFDRGGQVWAKVSRDDGQSWHTEPVLVARSDFGVATNPELLELQDGSVMCCFNERPKDRVHAFAILVCSSEDAGQNWSKPEYVYKADTNFENGCWEPAAIQLPDGEIQLYFANENPYRASGEQEITLLRSVDEGRTWKKPTTISFRGGHRDGMPVPILLQDGPKGIAVAIEDNGLSGDFKPVIVYSSLKNNWRSGPVSGEDPHRWPALSKPLSGEVYAGAPYLRQMPWGETILSFQSKEAGRQKPHMVVYVGNNWCRNFASRSVPFEVDADTPCLWNSLFVKSNDVITAVSGTTIHGIHGLWAIDGKLVRPSAEDAGAAKKKAEIVSVWQHRVDNGPPAFHVFYTNGAINNPDGRATWAVKGKELTMKWPSDKAKGGIWIDRCTLSSDGSSYSGKNQNGNKITGRLSQNQDSTTTKSR